MAKTGFPVVIHGHFYQPPREDPWTLEIEKQPSAYPFHDWNERINKECYAANAASRILDSSGRIEEILNNYRHISFNFGPTLMNWLKANDPKTFDLIVQADRDSRADNGGHGNAIAQVYNHIILPLASDRDIATEIEWGIRSFRGDFGRDPEGLWLSETAVNDRVAESVAAAGIRFLILSPHQAREFKPVHSGPDTAWKDVSDGSIDPSRPYLLSTRRGDLAVFFYFSGIATKISFEHTLRNVDYFRGELLSNCDPAKPERLVHVATDGENYGHHEPFADMCLARLLYENRTRGDFAFTNYAAYLDKHPPEYSVRLKEGNDGLGTAWSCGHGVDRWRKDCGDSTGGQEGWNQKWRQPLREAFDFLRDRLHAAAEKELGDYTQDVWLARNAYVETLRETGDGRAAALEKFFAEHVRRKEHLTDPERTLVIRVLEALHNALLMYTSCGWFFSEISGIETVQDMRYAGRVFELAGDILPPDTKTRFLEILEQAVSNIRDFQNGRRIYDQLVEKRVFSTLHAVNEYLLTTILTRDSILFQAPESWYYYRIAVLTGQVFRKGDWQVYKFKMRVSNGLLREEDDHIAYVFRCDDSVRTYVRKMVDDTLAGYLDKIVDKDDPKTIFRDFAEWFPRIYSLHDLNYDAKEKLLRKIFEKSMQTLHRKMRCDDIEIEKYLDIIALYQDLGVRLPDHDTVAIKELLENFILCGLEQIEELDLNSYSFSRLIKVIQTAKKAQFQINYTDILPYVRSYVLKRMNHAVVELDASDLENLEKIIDFTNVAGIDFEKYEIQNLLHDKLIALAESPGPFLNKYTVNILLRIAAKFNLAVQGFEQKLRNKFGS